MKKAKWCELCREKMGYKTHLLLISLIHLEIERAARGIKKRGFTYDEMHEKACALIRSVSKHNVHLNLAYAATQLLESSVGNSYIRA